MLMSMIRIWLYERWGMVDHWGKEGVLQKTALAQLNNYADTQSCMKKLSPSVFKT